MELPCNTSLYGFTVTGVEKLPEIDGHAYTLLHEKSGAKLLYLKNSDTNKAFSIAFKTPPIDNTGVFHILEHSVLCGSKKFPVKEPFVNLLKNSMQTFLNAMTFPDKTMYPVASTNEQDLLNLMDVYMDAVLHPAIYDKRAIFEQEGWHYELAKNNDQETLVYNGVVYNEMKGELSNPDSVLFNALSAALFPDTTYRFESGGTPADIPHLTYENFLDTHKRHYRLDNSYLTLYGNMNLERFLAFLDTHYLGVATTAPHDVGHPNPLHLQKPLRNLNVQHTMVTAQENACAAFGFVVGNSHDRMRMIAADILLDALMGSNEAPLKRALLDAGLADDAQAYLADAVLQPFLVVQLKGLSDTGAAHFWSVVESTAQKLAAGALDHNLIEASLTHAEFIMRERDFGIADGVALAMSSLSGWLYNENDATAYIRYEDAFGFLRQHLTDGYFETLIQELFLDNNHMASVEIIPLEQEETRQAHELAATYARMTPSGLQAIEDAVGALRYAQETPDSPEALATLPQLSVADIGPAPQEPAYDLITDTPLPCLRHHILTHGIAYACCYFDLSCLSFDELPYATILATILGKLDTTLHSAAEIDTLTQANLGNLTFFVEVHEDSTDRAGYTPLFVVSASSLSEKITSLAHIPHEILYQTILSDHTRIKDTLLQKRVALEQSFATAGHNAAMMRVSSYFLPAGVIREQMGGVDFYRFLKDLVEHFDERVDELVSHLSRIASRIFEPHNMMLSFTGAESDFTTYMKAIEKLVDVLPADNYGEKPCDTLRQSAPLPEQKNEAFIVSSDVVFTALGYDQRLLDTHYSGAWLVATRVLSYDYLWNEVRVKGGAYGSGFQATRSGTLRFYSYRDPHLDQTIKRFERAGAWLGSFSPAASEMDGYIVSSIAGLDAPIKPRELARRQDAQYFSRIDSNARSLTRKEVLRTQSDSLRELEPYLTKAGAQNLICVFGNKDIIRKAHATLTALDLLNETESK